MRKGACLCGAVSFEVEGKLAAPDACHCSQCRKQSGHYFIRECVPRFEDVRNVSLSIVRVRKLLNGR
jgi:hypothetical protein